MALRFVKHLDNGYFKCGQRSLLQEIAGGVLAW
jgi:hypothetical protein